MLREATPDILPAACRHQIQEKTLEYQWQWWIRVFLIDAFPRSDLDIGGI